MQENLNQLYDENFFKAQSQTSYISAQHVLKELNGVFSPQSVIDVGCGVGTWLKVWQEINPQTAIFGVDGNQVDSNLFLISQENYKALDFTQNPKTLLKEIPPPRKPRKMI